jgi:Domain of unknown function (DUF5666)/Carboxypeptidase regulatory-like domain
MRMHAWKVFPIALVLAACGSSSTGGARLEGMMDPASLSAARGAPVLVSLTGTSQSTATDASGRFSFDGLAPGEATLRFRGGGFDRSVRISGLAAGRTLQITVRITESGCEVHHAKENEVALVGPIAAVGTSSITISGLEVDTAANTRIEDHGMQIALSDLKKGDIVRVEGTLQTSGKVLASEIERLAPAGLAEVLLRGTVSSVDAAGSSFTVSGLKVVTDSSTKLVGFAKIGDLAMGDRVLVQGTLQSDGSVKARLVVKRGAEREEEEDENEVEIEGKITSITPPDHLVVAGKTIVVNSSTEFEAEHDQKLTFADLKVGDSVEVEAAKQADGTFLARKIQREDEDEDHHGG